MAEREADVGRRPPGRRGIAVALLLTPVERQQRPSESSGAGQQLVLLLRTRTGDRKLEQLTRHAERELVLELVSAGGKHPHSCLRRGLARLRQQRGLADAGRALDDHEPTRAIARVGDRRTQQAQLLCAFEQQRVGQRVTRPEQAYGVPVDTGFRNGYQPPGWTYSDQSAASTASSSDTSRLHWCFATVKKFSDDQAGRLAVVVAFYAFFSIFPLLLVFVTVLGYVLAGDHTLANSVSTSVLDRFPVIGPSIQGNHLKGDALALILGIVLALWSGSGVTGAMTTALEEVWEIPRAERANFPQQKLRGLLLLLALGVLFVLGSAASGVVSGGVGGTVPTVLAGIIVSFVINFALFLTSFHFLCAQPPGWRELIPGAALAAVFWTVLQSLGGVYIDHIKNSDSAYGTFALVLGILTWLHLGTQLTLYCRRVQHRARRQALAPVVVQPTGRATCGGQAAGWRRAGPGEPPGSE